MTYVVSVTAGSHQTGATTLAAGLSLNLCQRGYKVCLLDADWGQSNVSALLDIRADRTLVDLLDGRARLAQVIQHDASGLDILVGDNAAERMAPLSDSQLQTLADELAGLAGYDYLVVDVAAGSDRTISSFLEASDTVLVVITPDKNTQDAAYGLLERLHARRSVKGTHVVVNRARNHIVGRHSYGRLREVAEFYLRDSVPLLGIVSEADKPAVSDRPYDTSIFSQDTALGRDLQALAEKLLLQHTAGQSLPVDRFWKRYLQAAGLEAKQQQASTPEKADSPAYTELETQLDALTSQVESLIQRVKGCQPAPVANTQPALAESPAVVPPEGLAYWLEGVDYQSLDDDSTNPPENFVIRQQDGHDIVCSYYRAP